MALALARTNREAHLYIDLHPCVCGETGQALQSAVIEVEGELASRYYGACRSCGATREFVFALPPRPIPVPPGQIVFGDGTPSQLLDPGQWLWIADRLAGSVPAEPADVANLDTAQQRRVAVRLATAVAALGEALAFLPDGADRVPADAFFTDHGRAVQQDDPARFDRDRLQELQEVYGALLATLTAPTG